MSFEKKKGASDLLAYYVHRPIENWAVGHLKDTPVTPNQLTIATNIAAYAVTGLFFTGNLLAASLLSFAVGILDGLDGKLARAKNMATNLGKLEHAFDLLYEFSWLAALGGYLSYSAGNPTPLALAVAAITLISFYRYCYDTFGKVAGESLDNYAPFERVFRRFAGRRNLYNIHILVFVLLSRPELALYTIAGHAALTALVYSVRVGYHLNRIDAAGRVTAH